MLPTAPQNSPDFSSRKSKVAAALYEELRLAEGGDADAMKILLEASQGIASRVAKLARNGFDADLDLQTDTIICGLNAITARVDRNDEYGLNSVFSVAEIACGVLEKAAKREPKFVARFAETQGFWPTMMARKKAYHDAADALLESIGVGTKTIPPTTPDTKINAADLWTDQANRLLECILLYRDALQQKEAGHTSSSPRMRRVINTILTEATQFPELSALPERFDAESKVDYWDVAKRIAKWQWQRNPTDAAILFAKAGQSANESGEGYAIRKIRGAFYALADSQATEENTP